MDETKEDGENVPSPEVAEVVLVQYNLVYNQHQQKPYTLLAQINIY